jgi:tetratricopeptide (TPR) repeat protein
MKFDFSSFSHVFWIDASSTLTITQGLKGICNLPEAQSCALDGSLESALLWIGALKDNYVMVFDNADVLTPEELEQYFPPGLDGNILITSRNSAMQCLTSPANCLEVKEMAESDAISLLFKASCLKIPQTNDLHEKASEIVKELFCLPLAIDQAGAIIRSGAINIKDYLGIYSQQRKTMLSYPEFRGASKYNRTVYGTWELLYKEIQQRTYSADFDQARAAKNAILILAIFSFLHHDAISEDIFSNAAIQKCQTASGLDFTPGEFLLPLASSKLDYRLLPITDTGVWNKLIFKEGIQILLSFCFIRLGAHDSQYAVHPLIHAWHRDRMTSKERKEFCLMAYVMLACSLHKDFYQQPYSFRRALVTHVKANVQHSRTLKQHSYFDDASAKFVWILREQGYPKEAEIIAIKVLDVRINILGEDHQSTIWAVECLSKIYRDLGKYAEAENLQQQCLDRKIRLFGEENLHTITAMAGLGHTYNKMGKYREAEKLETKVLDARIKILGKEHPQTIASMGYLARTYDSLGKYAEAEKLQKQCLDTRIRLFGEEHPYTITAMACLGETCHKMGKYRDAEQLETKALDARIKILGKEHPHTITSMGYLAETYRSLGKCAEAEQLQKQCLDARIKILGKEHPHTITSMGYLAETYHSLGKYAEAEQLQKQCLDARIKILGKEHPHTITSMGYLAETYHSLGKYAEAEQLQRQCLGARAMLFGEEHPKTLITMEYLALTYKHLEKYKEAEELEIQVLSGRTRIFGETHKFTIQAMKNLAVTYRYLGKDADAEILGVCVQEAEKGM